VSTSERRSDSSGRSKRPESVFISTSIRDRANARGRGSGGSATGHKPPRKVQKPPSEARLLADARKTQRESRMLSQRRSGRLRAAVIVAAVVLVLGGCGALYSSPLFTIKTVEVVGNVHVSADAVRALARVPSDATLIRFPADAVAARVAADPWVSNVAVSRVFPSGMRIRVFERVPIAVVQTGSAKWLADATGMIIATATVEASGTLPVIRDVPGLDAKPGRRTVSEPLLNAIKVLVGISPGLTASVRSVSAPSVDGTTLLRSDHVEIVIGEAVDLATKGAIAEKILAQQKGKVVSIDVRLPDRPTSRGLK
jgi:cell division protein FtsQ